jgi:uncharacterized membrane protein YqaE (UPF0057 family)
MSYLIAAVLPPLAMLLNGKPIEALVCLVLQITIIGWIPAAIWALLVVNSAQADRRTGRIVKELRRREKR